MTVEAGKVGGCARIRLPSALGMPEAASLRDALLGALAHEKGDVVLDAAGVERLSTAAIQVVLAAMVEFRLAARLLAMEAVPSVVADGFRSLGLAAELRALSQE
jgi:chemotaxis protein CheX